MWFGTKSKRTSFPSEPAWDGELVEYEWVEVLLPEEPWKSHPRINECYIIPFGLVLFLADNSEFKNKSRNLEAAVRIDELRESIREEGLREPLTLVYDDNGKLRLKDGYHRTIAMQPLEPEVVPVFIKHTPGSIKAPSRTPIESVLWMIEALSE